MLNSKRFALALVALTLGFGRASRAATVEYNRHSIVSLIFSAEVVASGRIVALHEREESPEGDQTPWILSGGTFELEVERWVVGSGPERISVRQFGNWTCAARSVNYAVGQRVMLFARLPKQQGGPYSILGAGGEGELFLAGDDVLVRGFRVHGYPAETVPFGGAEVTAPRIDAAEWFAAVRGFREVFQWPDAAPGGGRSHISDGFDLRRSAQATEAFAKSSKSARHLFERAMDFPHLRSVRTPVRPAFQGLEELTFELPGMNIGRSVDLVELGDLDGDGRAELVLVERPRFRSGWHPGRMWVLFADAEGGFAKAVELDLEALGPRGHFSADERFGASVAAVGDINGDGVPDLAVGAPGVEVEGKRAGAVWVLFLDARGGVADLVELTGTEAFQEAAGGKSGGRGAEYGQSLTSLGDLDGDGLAEVLIGGDRFSFLRSSGGKAADVVVSLGPSGAVRWARGWSASGGLQCLQGYARRLLGLGDVDGDGIPDVAVGDPHQEDGFAGGVWIAFLGRDGSIRREQLISAWSGGLEAVLFSGDELGACLAAPGDVNGDGTPDLVVVSKECIRLFELRPDGSLLTDKKLIGLDGADFYRLAMVASKSKAGTWLTLAAFTSVTLKRVAL